jgi:hypothetical protein
MSTTTATVPPTCNIGFSHQNPSIKATKFNQAQQRMGLVEVSEMESLNMLPVTCNTKK